MSKKCRSYKILAQTLAAAFIVTMMPARYVQTYADSESKEIQSSAGEAADAGNVKDTAEESQSGLEGSVAAENTADEETSNGQAVGDSETDDGTVSGSSDDTTFDNSSSDGQEAAEGTNDSNVDLSLKNDYFNIKIGDYGQIDTLKIADDDFDTNYVLNSENAPLQGASSEHQWMGELIFKTKKDSDSSWNESMTSASAKDSKGRTITRDGDKIIVTYKDESSENGIKDFEVTETYELVDNKLKWSMKVTNTNDENLTFGDFGMPMPFNEYWTTQGNEQLYESRVIYHSFVGQDSSYIYAQRASGQGKYLLFTPDESTGAKLEYQDHWRTNNGHEGSMWAQDQGGWANGLNVFYIHSNVIKSTGSSYLDNTSFTLKPGESKEYSFDFTPVQNEKDMKSQIYNEGLIDAVAVPGMAFSKDMPAKFYLHTKYDIDKIKSVEVKCPHETHIYEGLENSVSNKQTCTKEDGTYADYAETTVVDGEKYHIYNLKLSCLGANNVVIHYLDDDNNEKETTLQFYAMDKAEDALNLHADFVADKTQVDAPGEIQDGIFDDWMMDSKSLRGIYSGYFGWGDDWGFTHGEYLAEKNVYLPVKSQIEAVDNYLDTFIWNGLMREHHEDYKVNDWLDNEPNSTGQGTSRGYAYPHVYNTYFSMYKIADKYPEMVSYREDKDTYLLRAYNVMKALYSGGVYYNWDTGLMGESTTPDIINALQKEGFYDEAQDIINIMDKKYTSFSSQKYPYGSEYSYDNTGEEAVYTLAKLQGNSDMMKKIDEKTRACRGLQPIWYHYANPTTICGENWWNFQYSASLIGYCMDDWLRLQDNGMSAEDKALAARVNYAAKLANLTAINSGQIDADPENIGTVAWTYQSELGNCGAQGAGEGSLHNGWRQMSGEADTGLFGAMRILSSDVVTDDPVFGMFGYGCEVTSGFSDYSVTPLDGLYTRLNFINEGLNVKLNRDQYTKAVVKKDCSGITLTMKNIEGCSHNSEIEVQGLKAGYYKISVNGTECESFKASDGKSSTISVPMDEAETSVVVIEPSYFAVVSAPKVDAGEDEEVKLSDKVRLEGNVSSDDSNDEVSKIWTVESMPEGAAPVIKNSDKLITEVQFDKTGEYVFKLEAADNNLTSSDTVKVTVSQDDTVRETTAMYTFDDVDISDKRECSLLSEDGGYDAERVSSPVFAEGKDGQGQALSLKGSYCGYVRMPAEVTKDVDECTISADINLNVLQNNGAKIFEFRDTEGRYFYADITSGNKIGIGITDSSTKELKEAESDVMLGSDYWVNAAVTIKDNTAVLYINGEEAAKIENCNFKLSDLSEVQRNFIGRGDSKTEGFFNGYIDNFTVKSKAMTESEVKEAYGYKGEKVSVKAEASDTVCKINEAPSMPSQVKVLYSDGLYYMEDVTWNDIDADKYSRAGTFTAYGKTTGLADDVKIKVHVVDGDSANIALTAEPDGIINSVNDLGGVKGLNDGYEPSSSSDTSNGVWHNWLGDQGGKAWVQYTWSSPVILTESDAYYFKDWAGNFAPGSVSYEYKDEYGQWHSFSNISGCGTELDKYNKTTFSPVIAYAIRMNMTPAALGCGVIEWQVYGYNVPDGNIAGSAEVTTSYVSPWETLGAVNDGKEGADSYSYGISHYGTWGNTSEYETVTYTWNEEKSISKSAIYFWNDKGGILTPASCSYEYLNEEGEWTEIPNAQGLGVELDKYNVTTFDAVKTKALRVKINKPNADYTGIGIVEWKVFESGE